MFSITNTSNTYTTAAAAVAGGETVITSLPDDIIQTHILTRLDGPTLASTSCGSSQLRHLCTDQNLWKKICSSYWPSISDPRVQEIISSFPAGHSSFFSDSYSGLDHRHHWRNRNESNSKDAQPPPETEELISAVDVHYGNELIYSKVIAKETSTGWFMTSPLRFDLLDSKESVPTPVKFDGEEGTCTKRLEENMRLTWIVMDPKTKRAVNLSSVTPVEVRRHWLTGEIQLWYTTVMAGRGVGEFVKCGVMVTCGGKEGRKLQVREISMQVEDMEGKIVCGKDSLVILQEAMQMRRKKIKIGEEMKRYEMLMEMRRIRREKREKRERRLDLVCIVSGVSIFMSFWLFLLYTSTH